MAKIYENENFKVEFAGISFQVTDKKTNYTDCGAIINGSIVGRTQKAYRIAKKAQKELNF